jgi:hypothetical protein
MNAFRVASLLLLVVLTACLTSAEREVDAHGKRRTSNSARNAFNLRECLASKPWVTVRTDG